MELQKLLIEFFEEEKESLCQLNSEFFMSFYLKYSHGDWEKLFFLLEKHSELQKKLFESHRKKSVQSGVLQSYYAMMINKYPREL